MNLWYWFAGAVFGYGSKCLHEYLDDIKGDVFCYEWPRCWKRATHYIEVDGTPIMDEGMCEHHAHKRVAAVLVDPQVEPDMPVDVYNLPTVIRRARIRRALNPFDNGDEN
jgi:hypothetical protein